MSMAKTRRLRAGLYGGLNDGLHGGFNIALQTKLESQS